MAAPDDRLPPQIKFIVGNEALERFAFYGARAILTIHMARSLLLPEHEARAGFHAFVAVSYLAPLLGAWLAERYWGRFRVIVGLSLAYVAGAAILALWGSRAGLAVGLALVALGSGGVKPCVSAFVADQFPPERKGHAGRVFALFSWFVNLASFGATLATPLLLARHGPAIAFGVPGLLVAAALGAFWLGRRGYVRAPPSGPDPHHFLRVVGRALQRLGTQPGHWLDAASDHHPPEAIAGAKAVLRVLAIFAAVVPFWALFDQQGSAWPLQAARMDLALPGGLALEAAQLAALNPLLVLVMLPLFSRGVFPLLERRGTRLTALRKMTAGMFLMALAFVAAAVLEHVLATGARPSALWQLPQYAFLTAGEVLVSVTGLEFSSSQAPRAMRGTILGLWMLSVAAGNALTAFVAWMNVFQGPAWFWFSAVLVLGGALAFRLLVRHWSMGEGPATVPFTLSALPIAGGEAQTQRFNLPARRPSSRG